MEPNYAATYRFQGSKTVVHIVAPPPVTEEERDIILRGFHLAAWAAWNSLTDEERSKLNLGVDLTKVLQWRLHRLIIAESSACYKIE
ncbi:MAG: hypothetical protein K0R55_2125 [Sporomusa sp.]|nr:hypothetical protein [Sporomusa sp.]